VTFGRAREALRWDAGLGVAAKQGITAEADAISGGEDHEAELKGV